jgi:hypothetical protein
MYAERANAEVWVIKTGLRVVFGRRLGGGKEDMLLRIWQRFVYQS